MKTMRKMARPLMLARFVAAGALFSVAFVSAAYSILTGEPSPATAQLVAALGGAAAVAAGKAASVLS